MFKRFKQKVHILWVVINLAIWDIQQGEEDPGCKPWGETQTHGWIWRGPQLIHKQPQWILRFCDRNAWQSHPHGIVHWEPLSKLCNDNVLQRNQVDI